MRKNRSSGQALVEYGFILLLVALAAVAVLALLGPSIAQAYDNVTSQLEPGWTFCADEHQTCTFTGTRQVRYGKNDHWNYGTFTDSVQCENSVFGDPLFGTIKECAVKNP